MAMHPHAYEGDDPVRGKRTKKAELSGDNRNTCGLVRGKALRNGSGAVHSATVLGATLSTLALLQCALPPGVGELPLLVPKIWHADQLHLCLTLRGGTEPPLVEELFKLGFDKNLYTRATFYNQKGQRIPPPKGAFSPGPVKENWAAEEMEAMAHRVEPDQWPDGHPGYDGHPFAGVKRPGWFLEEYIEQESKDPHIQELNRALWEACTAGDAKEAHRLLEQGAQVNAGDPREGDMWNAMFYCCTLPPAAGLPDVICNDTALVAENKRLDLLECLLAHGALVQARDLWGETPLHYAAVRGILFKV